MQCFLALHLVGSMLLGGGHILMQEGCLPRGALPSLGPWSQPWVAALPCPFLPRVGLSQRITCSWTE